MKGAAPPLARMIAGLSRQNYRSGLEPVGAEVEERAVGTGKSSLSRRFIAQTATALAELLARPLNEVDLVALMVDGVHFGEQTCLVALAIDITGVKHPLAIVKAPRRTPPWCVNCWPASVNAVWRSHARFWS